MSRSLHLHLRQSKIELVLLNLCATRVLLGGWALLITAMLGVLLLAVLAPGSWDGDLLKPLLALNVVVMLGTLAYAAVFAVRQLRYYLGAWLKKW